jgi:hypothetical protein
MASRIIIILILESKYLGLVEYLIRKAARQPQDRRRDEPPRPYLNETKETPRGYCIDLCVNLGTASDYAQSDVAGVEISS